MDGSCSILHQSHGYLVPLGGNLEGVPLFQAAGQHQVGGGVLHQVGDGPAEGTGAVLPAAALAGQEGHRLLLHRR